MTTLIVNYQTTKDKAAFNEENKDAVNKYNIIYVNDRSVDGVRIDLVPEYV